ncbi:MAG: flagellar GTP-binding protein, partial [bacterium]|nr:flagellar GTP-binding protein [bacterium]
MQTKQYRAASMHEALEMIRRDLGAEASVLHARETRGGLFGWFGEKEVEVTASLDIEVPSRFTTATPKTVEVRRRATATTGSLLEDLCSQHDHSWRTDGNGPLVRVYQQLLAAELGETLAAELVQRLRMVSLPTDLQDESRVNHRLARMLEDELVCCGPIQPATGRCKRVALVGPTGVGKTTTVAKLAATFRVQNHLQVGLITVDTFRVAAVDQL